MRQILALTLPVAFTLAFASFEPGGMPPRADSSRAALTSLGQEYGDLQQWATALAAASDTLDPENAERARVLADQLARIMKPLEQDFENTTAALSTSQLELILPLWERMAFAHAGFALLQERASTLGLDPVVDPSELHDLAAQLQAVLDFAAEIQRLALNQLTTPLPIPTRLT
jgi:erythromycin esterase-like protein